MTVQTEVSRSGPYAGAGTTGPFTVGFRFLADSHLRVIQTSALGFDADLVLATDYSVTGAGDSSGTLTLAVALPIGASLTIIRNVPFVQEADYVDNDAFPAESHEAALDLLTMQTQQIKEAQDRALALSPTSDSGVSTELPSPVANNLLAWNESADALRNLDHSAIAGVVSYGTFLAETFDGTGVATDFVVTGNPLTIGNLDVSVSGVVQSAGIHFTFIPPKTVRFISGAPSVGTDNVLIRHGSSLVMGEATAVTGQTSIGTALITAADAAAARSAIGSPGLSSGDTFTVSPNVPTPTTADQAANKEYADTAIAAAVSTIPTVRQTVLSGPVDTNGFPAFGGSPGSTTVTAAGTLVATAANGVSNRTGSITNPSWTGLSTNGTMALFLDIAADGTCTPVSSALLQTLRWGGADVTTDTQFTFNVQEMIGKVGNGSVATQAYRVAVGEVTVSGGVVSAITWYALMGRFIGQFAATLPLGGVYVEQSHLIGTNFGVDCNFEVECTSASEGYAVGDLLSNVGFGAQGPLIISCTRKIVFIRTHNSTFLSAQNKSTGATAALTSANFKYRLSARRNW